jgi:hypothetical protein
MPPPPPPLSRLVSISARPLSPPSPPAPTPYPHSPTPPLPHPLTPTTTPTLSSIFIQPPPPAGEHGEGTPRGTSQTLVKPWSNPGQTLVKQWSNTGQTQVKHRSNTGQTLVKHWSLVTSCWVSAQVRDAKEAAVARLQRAGVLHLREVKATV